MDEIHFDSIQPLYVSCTRKSPQPNTIFLYPHFFRPFEREALYGFMYLPDVLDFGIGNTHNQSCILNSTGYYFAFIFVCQSKFFAYFLAYPPHIESVFYPQVTPQIIIIYPKHKAKPKVGAKIYCFLVLKDKF